MSTRTTLVLLAIALLLGGYVWLVEVRGTREKAEAEEAEKRLVGLASEDLVELELETLDGPTARLALGEAGVWRLEAPVEYAADADVVRRVLDALDGLAYDALIEPLPADLEPFGLGDGGRGVVLKTGLSERLEIRLGGSTPVGGGRYLTLSSRPGRIYIAPQSSTTALEPALLDVRDKRITRVGPDEVRELTVRLAGELLVRAARVDDGWHLTEPIEDRADAERIERLIDDLYLARASGFVDAPEDLARYGLEPPEIELELGLEEGVRKVMLGRAGDEAYARLPERSTLLQVRDRVVDGIPRDVFGYRHKRVLTLDEDAIHSVELAFPRDDLRYRFERDDYRWKPEDETLQVDSFKVSDVLFGIEELGATGLEPAPDLTRLGLDTPRVRVSVRDEAGEVLGWLELGDSDPKLGLAARSSSAERVWRVENSLGEDVPLGLEAFRNNWLKESEPAKADAVEAGSS